MAQFNGSVSLNSGKYSFYIVANETGTSIDGNTSTVIADVYLQWRSFGWISSRSFSGTIDIGGAHADFSFSPNVAAGSNTTIKIATLTNSAVPHNADGTGTVLVSATFSGDGSYSPGYCSASGTLYLSTIPRKSSATISYAEYSSGTNAGRLSVNISRASSSFSHNVNVTLNGKSYYKSGVETATYFDIPLADLPNGVSFNAAVSVTTISGGSNIGSNSYTEGVSVPAFAAPSVSGITADPVTGLIKTKTSTLLQIVGATPGLGSTISAYRIWSTNPDFSANSQSYTYSTNTAGNITVSATITDQRGRTSSPVSVSFDVADYVPPVVTELLAARCNAAGALSEDGIFFKIMPTFTDGLSTGTIAKQYRFSTGRVGGDWQPIEISTGDASSPLGGNLDADKTYTVEFKITDVFGAESIRTATLPTAFYPFDTYGKSVSIGKAVEADDLFEVNLPAQFNKNTNFLGDINFKKEIYIGGTVLRDYIYPVGAVIKTFNSANPADTIGGTWTKIREDYDRIPVGSQVLYTQWYNTSPSSTEYKILGAYDYGMFDGLFSWQGVRVGYHREYKVTAQITTNGNNHIKMWFNNVLLMDVGTFSVPEYQGLYSSSFFKETDIILRPTLDYPTYGVNLYIQNVPGTAASTTAIANNITIHGVFASDKKMFTWERTA